MHTKNKGKPKKNNKTQAYSTPSLGPGPGVEVLKGTWPRVQKCKENHRKNKGNVLRDQFGTEVG